jgi:hypothetical protein
MTLWRVQNDRKERFCVVNIAREVMLLCASIAFTHSQNGAVSRGEMVAVYFESRKITKLQSVGRMFNVWVINLMVRKSTTEPLSNIDCFPKRWLIGWFFFINLRFRWTGRWIFGDAARWHCKMQLVALSNLPAYLLPVLVQQVQNHGSYFNENWYREFLRYVQVGHAYWTRCMLLVTCWRCW